MNVSDGTWPRTCVPTPESDVTGCEVSRVVDEVVAANREGVRSC